MTQQEKALAIVHALAHGCERGEVFSLGQDWGLGSGTVSGSNGHTHIGIDDGTDAQRLEYFVDGLYDLVVEQRGLSWAGNEK